MVNKNLKITSGRDNVEFYLIVDGEEIPLKKQDIRNLITEFLKDVRLAYIKFLPNIELIQTGKYFTVNINSKRLTNENLSNSLTKLIPKNYIELEINGSKVKLDYKKDYVATSILYSVAKDITGNLKEGKTVVIKNLQYLARIKPDKNTPYDKAFSQVIKEFEIVENGKTVECVITFSAFKNASIKVKFKMNLRKKNFAVNNSYYQILNRIKNQEYKVAYIGIGYREKKGAFLLISYKFEKQPETSQEQEKVMGVDLGQVYLIYYSITNSHSRGDISLSYSWKDKIIGIWNRKKHLQKSLMEIRNLKKQGINDESIEKRYEKIVKELNSVREYEKNFMETLNKQIATKLIDIAVKEKVKTIVLEDLSLSNEEKNSLAFPKWNYYQLQSFIENKAQENGIQVKKINPAYTSQRCPSCGFIAFYKEMVRPKREKFTCPVCGFSSNADYVASLNIAEENIEEKIKARLISDIEKIEKVDKNKKVFTLFAIRNRIVKDLLKEFFNTNNGSLKKLLKRLEISNKEAYNTLIRDLKQFKVEYLDKRISNV